jgi:uncharacterized cupin superfamily protein
MPLRRPAIRPADVPDVRGTSYPEPFKSRVIDRVKKKLGDELGLTQFGVNLVTLGAGSQSALRHWHTHEDEFVYIVSGEVVLVTDSGEQTLKAGDCAGYPAGSQDAHHFINRSGAPAVYLEVGTRSEQDLAIYPDDDLMWANQPSGEPAPFRATGTVAAHKDGKPY